MIKLTGKDAPQGYKKVVIDGLHMTVVKQDGTVHVIEPLEWGYHQQVIKAVTALRKANSAVVQTHLD